MKRFCTLCRVGERVAPACLTTPAVDSLGKVTARSRQLWSSIGADRSIARAKQRGIKPSKCSIMLRGLGGATPLWLLALVVLLPFSWALRLPWAEKIRGNRRLYWWDMGDVDGILFTRSRWNSREPSHQGWTGRQIDTLEVFLSASCRLNWTLKAQGDTFRLRLKDVDHRCGVPHMRALCVDSR